MSIFHKKIPKYSHIFISSFKLEIALAIPA